MCIGIEKPLKVSKITVIGQIVQVMLQHKVGATPELGPKFREVNAAGGVLTIEEVSLQQSFIKSSDGA